MVFCVDYVAAFVVVIWEFVGFDVLALCLVVCLGLFGVAAWRS